jgi:hypothetical protein
MIEYTLYRIEDDETTTEISHHESIADGMVAAGHIIEHVDYDYAYELHSDMGRVATFAEGRIGYREWATRTVRISPSLEDKYDHDEDMLLA